jgi:hypothetical protein
MAKDSKKGETSGLVKIVYVGRKPSAIDNVARSGKLWNGFGDVQEVTSVQANILLRYPDQWAVFDQKSPPSKEGSLEENLQRMNEMYEANKGQRTGHSLNARRLEDMSETELVDHARHYYGLELDPKLPIDEMRMFIEDAVVNAAKDAEKLRNDDTLGSPQA